MQAYHEELRRFDAKHIWHPYSTLPGDEAFIIANGARGTRIGGVDPWGNQGVWIDAMASWWAVIHGYNHPHLVEAARRQLDQVCHVMFGGITHAPAVELARRLLEILPGKQHGIFYADSGSIAVEIAIKVALQYWRSTGNPQKSDILTWKSGYHGDTHLTMSLCDSDGFHKRGAKGPVGVYWASAPPLGFSYPLDNSFLNELEQLFEQHGQTAAAFILEPVVQGAGGMRIYNPGYMRHVQRLATAHDVLLISDEIATGFGRTCALFASDWAALEPDIVCVGKALTGGMLSLAATTFTSKIAQTIHNGPEPLLAHGPTYMGNPLACAVACASLDLLASKEWESSVSGIQGVFSDGLEELRALASVRDVRVLGAAGIIELHEPVDVTAATLASLQCGVWIRPFGHLIYALPPYCVTVDEANTIVKAMREAVWASSTGRDVSSIRAD